MPVGSKKLFVYFLYHGLVFQDLDDFNDFAESINYLAGIVLALCGDYGL